MGSEHVGFTDDRDHSFPTIPNISDMSGLEDFQDGWACGDAWSPQSARGASSYLMVR